MRTKLIFQLLAAGLFVACPSCHRESYEGVANIDVTQVYPEKEILLSDIADVTYLQMKSDDDEYLFKGSPVTFGTNTVVIQDQPASGRLLFFSKDGNPKSNFGRKGSGPEEYTAITQVVYDEEKDEVFVAFRNVIQVYSSDGEYRRKISLPVETFVNPFVSFDEHSLFLYDASAQTRKVSVDGQTGSGDYFASPFVRISKTDGRVLDYVELPEDAETELGIYRETDGIRMMVRGLTHRVVKCAGGVMLCNPETDTVFFYGKDGVLTPVIAKTPPVSGMDPMIYLNNCIDAGRYQFMEAYTVRFEEGALPYPATYLMRDKETNEVFRQKIVLPDYLGKRFVISPRQTKWNYENGAVFELDLIELKQAYEENKLGGRLKDMVAASNEDEDNNIFVLFHFK
jgi:hypothetical protein